MKINSTDKRDFVFRTLAPKDLKSALSSVSENAEISDGGIKVRPGMKLLPNPVLYSPEEFSDGVGPFSLTDFFLEIRGRRACIALAVEDDQKSNIYYHFFAVYSDCTKDRLGTVTFSRVDSYTFGVPTSFVIFSGRPTTGGGIYFMTRVTYGKAIPDETRIYEISSDLFGWNQLTADSFYLPTVLIHGRGDSYNRAFSEGEIKLSVPRQSEPLNLLCQTCALYYTTDGYSSSFTLPDYGFTRYEIEAELTLKDGSIKQFLIGADSTVSGGVNINGVSTVMRVDRSLCRVFFMNEKGAAEVPQYTASENNLKFTLRPTENTDSLLLSSMRQSAKLAAKSGSGGAAVLILYDSTDSPDTLLWCDPERPLYFPKSCTLSLTVPQGRIAKITEVDGRLLIFKQNMIFSAGFTAAEQYDLAGIINGVADSGKISFPKYVEKGRAELSAKIISDTVKSYPGKVFFCTEDRKICQVTPSLAVLSTLRVSQPPIFAAVMEGRYLLYTENGLFVTSAEGDALLKWRLPAKLLGAVFFGDTTVFFAKTDNGAVYGFNLDGGFDSYLLADEYDLIQSEIDATAELTLAEEGRFCRLLAIAADAADEGKPISAKLYGDGVFISEQIITAEERLFCPTVFRRLSAVFKMQGVGELSGVTLKYSRLKRV